MGGGYNDTLIVVKRQLMWSGWGGVGVGGYLSHDAIIIVVHICPFVRHTREERHFGIGRKMCASNSAPFCFARRKNRSLQSNVFHNSEMNFFPFALRIKLFFFWFCFFHYQVDWCCLRNPPIPNWKQRADKLQHNTLDQSAVCHVEFCERLN